jgi:hypothetical protein
LADTFPVTQALVGEAFFRAMAGQFVRAHPPRSPVLTLYGDLFPSYVCDFAPASALPYLGDLARLEVGYVQTYHAAEEDPVTGAFHSASIYQCSAFAICCGFSLGGPSRSVAGEHLREHTPGCF